MADSESDNGLAQRRGEVSDLAAIERRLAAIEKVVWALATHAGIAVDPCPSCESGTLQYKIDKSRRSFGKVRVECDTCDHASEDGAVG
tara:strand:+ start:1020 stop:1283 length:264 start_codon:yes stop_codon:yes gene_type:complete